MEVGHIEINERFSKTVILCDDTLFGTFEMPTKYCNKNTTYSIAAYCDAAMENLECADAVLVILIYDEKNTVKRFYEVENTSMDEEIQKFSACITLGSDDSFFKCYLKLLNDMDELDSAIIALVETVELSEIISIDDLIEEPKPNYKPKYIDYE